MNAALRLVDTEAWSIAGWSLLHYVWIGAVLGVLAWMVKRAARPLSPQARYAVAVLMLAALAIAPPVIAWRVTIHHTNAPQAEIVPDANEVLQLPLPADAAITQLPASPALPASVLAQPTPNTPQVETIDAFLTRHVSNFLATVVQWAPAVWLLGMPLTLAFLATGLFGAERLRKRSSPLAEGPIADAVRRWAEVLRISRTVAVGVSDRVVAPLVIGVVRPMIVLPASIVARQSPEQMEMILLHELSHVRRADNLVNLVQRVIEAVLFFQPAVWFVSRWVRLEREHCCDNMVLSYTGDPQGYAETLASLAMPGISPAYAAAAMANHQLVSRIQHILSREEQTMSLSPKIAAVAGAVCLVVGFSLSGAAQQASPMEEPTTSSVADPVKYDEAASNESASKGYGVRTMADIARVIESQHIAEGTQLDQSAVSSLADLYVAESSDSGVYLNFVDAINGATKASADKRPWGPEQATGAPDVPNAGDDARAWASLTEDNKDEWLELTYSEPVEVIAVQVFASYCPGAVNRVTVFDANTPGLQYTWQGDDPVIASGPRARGVSIITIPTPLKTNRVRVDIASRSVRGWNEIDAVGLLDASGKTHWATSATASSTYAERPTTFDESLDTTQRLFYRQALIQARQAQAEADAANEMAQLADRNGPKLFGARGWSPAQATGAPVDVSVANVNDRRHAWRPAQADAGRETLDVFYSQPVKAKLVLVYELGVPAIVDITCRGNDGASLRVLSGRNVRVAQATTVLSLPLDGRTAISSITLDLDTAAVDGWTDIDAVGLIDAEGKVHWADRAEATSMHGVTAERPWRSTERPSAAKLGVEWLKAHQSSMSKASCVSCHENAPREVESRAHPAVRVPVKELLDMSDAELRDWLIKHGAANVHIGNDEQAAVVGFDMKSVIELARSKAEGGTEAKPAPTSESGSAAAAPPAKSAAQLALDAMASKEHGVWRDLAAGRVEASRIAEYEKAFRAQSDALALSKDGVDKVDRERLKDWIAMRNRIAEAEQIQIALHAGERGYFSRPNYRIVRAERVEDSKAKNPLALTITGDGLEFMASEAGQGTIRCWDQDGKLIEVRVIIGENAAGKYKPKPKPAGSTKPATRDEKNKPDPNDASQRTPAAAFDGFVRDALTGAEVKPPADRHTLARRAYLDNLGTLPTTDQLKSFVGDGSPETLAKSLEELAAEAAKAQYDSGDSTLPPGKSPD
jgi:beta-lactamase regulating signal transducer with metallopeptidase domain